MKEHYENHVKLFKALSDTNRLMIVDMLSCGEMCACSILEKFDITQPTLSHHMKILCESGIVSCRREGKWMHYSLNKETVQNFYLFLDCITSDTENCICNKGVDYDENE